MKEIAQQAADLGERYVLARCNFLQCIVAFSLGDLPAARIHGVRSVELLPDDAPTTVRIDHLIMLAAAYGPGAQSDTYYRHALDLAASIGDTDKTIAILNNLAYFSWELGERAKALDHVEQMMSLSALRKIPLKASTLDTVAHVYMTEGRFAEAIELLAPATTDGAPTLHTGHAGGVLHTEPYALPECLLTLAQAHRLQGDLAQATACTDRAGMLAEERGLTRTSAAVLRERASLSAAQGDYRSAYELHIAFHELSVSLYSEEQDARARTVQASYDADERQRDAARFRELAIRDALTGLYNRRFVDEQLALLTAQSTSRRTALSAAIVDADFFKRVNDERSHEVGDRVLQEIARILESAVVTPETVGRLGGEEFVILMPEVSAEAAFARCEQVRATIHQHDWTSLVGDLPITVSIGVSTAATGQTSAAALLSDADRNLYAAKRSGRNRVMCDAR